MSNPTLRKFTRVYNKHAKSYSKFVRFLFKLFSKTERDDTSTKNRAIYTNIMRGFYAYMFILFVLGAVGHISENDSIGKIPVILFFGSMVCISVLGLIAKIYNRRKINKICNELSIDKAMYDELYRRYIRK